MPEYRVSTSRGNLSSFLNFDWILDLVGKVGEDMSLEENYVQFVHFDQYNPYIHKAQDIVLFLF